LKRGLNILDNLFGTQIFLLCLMMAGFITAKAGIIDDHARSSLSDLILCVFFPCTILMSFLDTSLSQLSSLAVILLISALTQVICFVLSKYALYRKVEPEQKKVLSYATIISNASFLGNPIIESIYGLGALVYSAVYLVPLRISLWTLGIAFFSGGKISVKKIIFHPCIIATFLGILAMLTDYAPPQMVTRLAFSLGNCTTPVSMMVVGSVLGLVKPNQVFNALALYYAFVRLIFIPLLIMGLLAIMGLLPVLRPAPIVSGVSIILTATPAPVTISILANKYRSDRELASKIVFVSTLFSIVTMPVFVWLLTFLP
jgi:predicted permease